MNEVLRYAILLCLAFSQPFGNFGIQIRRRLLGYISPDSRRGGSRAVSALHLFDAWQRPELQVVGEVSDGLASGSESRRTAPDLILLDIGLPSLNGIEAARRIRRLSPESKILFVSQESSADVVREALGTGASGYIVKTDAGRELLEGVNAVLRGELFIGERFSGHYFVEGSGAVASQKLPTKDAFAPLQRSMEIDCRHEVGFYSDDASLLDGFTQFIGAALKSGSAVIVDRDRVTPGRPSTEIAGSWLGYWCRD